MKNSRAFIKENPHPRIGASMTVEAAFVIPLGFYAIMAFVYIFLMLHTEFTVYEGLLSVSDELAGMGAVGAYAEQSDILTDIIEAAGKDVPDSIEELAGDAFKFLSGEVSGSYAAIMIKKKLKASDSELDLIAGGIDGIDCTSSRVYGGSGRIILTAEYEFHFPLFIFGIFDKKISQSIELSGFYGTDWDKTAEFDDSRKRSEDDAHPPEEYVYRTPSGAVYHRDPGCSYINIVVEEIYGEMLETKRNQSGAIYYPCEQCVGAVPDYKVYVTAYGTRYHNDRSCSKIERNPLRLSITEAEDQGLRPCSKCGEREED